MSTAASVARLASTASSRFLANSPSIGCHQIASHSPCGSFRSTGPMLRPTAFIASLLARHAARYSAVSGPLRRMRGPFCVRTSRPALHVVSFSISIFI